jgi:hypothetical protein
MALEFELQLSWEARKIKTRAPPLTKVWQRIGFAAVGSGLYFCGAVDPGFSAETEKLYGRNSLNSSRPARPI